MRKIWILLLIFLLIFSLNFFSFKKSLKNSLFLVFEKPFSFFNNFVDSFAFFLERLKRNEQLTKENLSCQNKLSSLESKSVLFEELKRENEFLKKALNLGLKEKKFDLELAKVIAVYPFEDKILIDQGKKNGLAKGMFVILDNLALAGEVDDVFDDFSVVSLISNKNFSLAAKIEGKEIFGLVQGRGSGRVFLEKILNEKQEKIEENDIVLSWLSERIPNDILIGRIKQLAKNQSREAKIEPYFSLKKTDLVFVVKNFKK
ncbi:MAG: rod shape-determining protein MreC [Minisyncoccales bacterium]